MPPRLCGLLAVLAPLVVCAQTAAVSSADGSRGVTLLPGSAAWTDDATALTWNPAGLGRSGTLSAIFMHERANTRALDADGLFVSSALADVAGLAVSFESVRPFSGPARARTALGFSLGPEQLSLGAALVWHFGGPAEGTALGVDLGVQSRPARWLSLGAVLRNANLPATASVSHAREYALGLGLRPVGERLTLGVDWFASEALPVELSRLQYTVAAQVTRGVRLLAGVSHGFSPTQPLAFQLGLGLDLEHFGYTQGAAVAGDRANWHFMARYSSEAYPALLPQKKIAVVGLGSVGQPSSSTVGALLGLAVEDRFLRLLRTLERAARDPELAALVLKVETAGVGLARADELRSAVLALRAAGKKVYAYLLTANDAEYLIASACDGIYAPPEALFMVDGLKSTATFLGGAAEKLDIAVDVARVGAYKNFPDQFTRTGMSAQQREALSAYLDTASRTLEQRVVSQRKLTPELWRASLEEGLKSTRRARELGELDGLLTPRAFDEFLRAQVPGAVVDHRYSPFAGRDARWGTGPQIAIVPVLGNISGGKDQASPIGGELIAGAESFIASIAEAAEDPDVAAIVVRVDSGGGDGLASSLMYEAVLEAKKKKPVVASMGDLAASGGYYVAAGADEIWASPTTLTGSIGVFFAKPAIKGLAARLGVTQESISRGSLAGINDVFDPWTPAQRTAAQKWVDDFYDTFITAVASSRKLTKAQVDAVAQGRVWSGEDAHARHLVDHLGGLMEAVASARKQAGISASEDDLELVVWHTRRGVGQVLLSAAAPEGLLEAPLPSTALPAALQPLARQLGPDAWLLGTPALQARMEYSVDLQ